MGKFLVVIILIAGGWYYFSGSTDDAAAIDANGSTSDGSIAIAGTATENADGTPNFAAAGDDDVPADLQAALDEADRQWAEFKAEKTDATLHDLAPSLARTYSDILKQTYNQPNLKNMQLRIVKDNLTPLAKRLFFSSKTYKKDTSGLFATHTIKTGENLNAIGRTCGMSYEFINVLRGKSAQDEIYSQGDELKLLNAKKQGYLLHIDKSDFYMDVFVRDVFIKRYDIGHGAVETDTPSGETFIRQRVLHPQWTDPKTKRVYNYGDPGHILGPVWLAFDKEIGKAGLGIHGYTGKGKSTGVQASNGCIRMKNDEAEELYWIMVPTSTTGKFITRAPMTVKIVE